MYGVCKAVMGINANGKAYERVRYKRLKDFAAALSETGVRPPASWNSRFHTPKVSRPASFPEPDATVPYENVDVGTRTAQGHTR